MSPRTIATALATRRRRLGQLLDRRRLRNRGFTLFSNDCWGAEVYKHFNLPFNTPFIGLMLMAPCYLRLLARPQHYLALPLRFVTESRYSFVNELRARRPEPFPLATLGEEGQEVEIQFLHYHSEAEAREKWTRRAGRVNWDNLFLKFDGGKDYATPELVQRFEALPYPRLTLLPRPQAGIGSAVVVPQYSTDGLVQFGRSLPYYDLIGWFNEQRVALSWARRINNALFFAGG
ncbi:DUF1919 domain-containing protein [uncultured Hymenobacter sp.]|uniref:DUF1919 domain-containing protein n=1 Tax=uncultured Hymenobacter sp. TaxID=170016 RepID=UPI0035CC5747